MFFRYLFKLFCVSQGNFPVLTLLWGVSLVCSDLKIYEIIISVS